MADRKTAEKRRAERPGPGRRVPSKGPSGSQAQLQTLSFTRKNWILFSAGLGSVALGFLLLRLGDITLAPILLLAGYLVLIPWSLIARRKPPQGRDERDPDPQTLKT